MERILTTVPGVQTSRFVPEIANHVPHLAVKWDAAAMGISKVQCAKLLREGDLSIEVLDDGESNEIAVTPFMMKPGEELIVAKRIKSILEQAKGHAAGKT
jgi:hypothetical protein